MDDSRPTIECAVLLAAGRGTRLKGMTRTLPKCMVPVCGRTILERAVEAMTSAGVRRLVVVTGHEHETLEAYLPRLATSLDVEFIHSPDYATTNNIVSLLRVGDAVRDDFYLLESDLIFSDELLPALGEETTAAVSPLKQWMDGTVLSIDAKGRIERMYLKNDARPDKPLFKTVNIYAIAGRDWRDLIHPALDAAVSAGETNSYYERIFAVAIADGRLSMRAAIVGEEAWREVDTPEDLALAEEWLKA